MHWSPFVHNPHFFISNVAYIVALALLVLGAFRQKDAAIFVCGAWMLVTICLIFRVWSVCAAFPPNAEHELICVLCAAPPQLLIPPFLLSFLVSSAHLARNYRGTASRGYLISWSVLLVCCITTGLIIIFSFRDLDFSHVNGWDL